MFFFKLKLAGIKHLKTNIPYRTRTDIKALKGQCPNLLDERNRPILVFLSKQKNKKIDLFKKQ